jgi:hypothetical protein
MITKSPEMPDTVIRVSDLVFKPHRVAEQAGHMLDMGNELTETIREMMTARQAVVQFENGIRVSLINCIPQGHFPIMHGDLRIPTFEVMITGGDVSEDERGPFNEMTVAEVEALFARMMSRTRSPHK